MRRRMAALLIAPMLLAAACSGSARSRTWTCSCPDRLLRRRAPDPTRPAVCRCAGTPLVCAAEDAVPVERRFVIQNTRMQIDQAVIDAMTFLHWPAEDGVPR